MTEEGFFKKFFGAGQAIVDLAKRPGIRRGMKSKLNAAYDCANNHIIDAEKILFTLRQNFENYDVSKILDQMDIITRAKELQANIKTEYKIQFAKEMKIVEDDDDED
jgi:hypothetical protein